MIGALGLRSYRLWWVWDLVVLGGLGGLRVWAGHLGITIEAWIVTNIYSFGIPYCILHPQALFCSLKALTAGFLLRPLLLAVLPV